ncbi:MAG: hypothetical protein AAB601_01295 [Patescibacteria group bacterium]
MTQRTLTLIKGGTVYDGSGAPPRVTDVLIRDGMIAQVGNVSARSVHRVIRASNAAVVPGFIDVNTSSDHFLTLFSNPLQGMFLSQGVTSIVGGNCGSSLAPLLGAPLEAVGEWGHPTNLNTNWNTVREFLAVIDRLKLGVNFGTLVGHASVRRRITGGEFRDLTDPELALFEQILINAFQDGALGLSSGLSRAHSVRVDPHEIAALVATTARSQRVYATHIRNFEDRIRESVEEALALAKRFHVSVEVSHLIPRAGFTSGYTEAITAIERAAAESVVHFDLYPFEVVEQPFYTLLPLWAQYGNRGEMLVSLRDPGARRRLREHFDSFAIRDFRFAHVFEPPVRFLEGRILADLARPDEPVPDLIMRLMQLTHLRATVVKQVADLERLEKALGSTSALIASNAPAVLPGDFADLRSTRTFTSFLERVRKDRTIPFERIVQRLTAVPAEKYRLAKRGRIAERNHADLVVLQNEKPTHVFVNGTLAVDEGNLTGARSGTALRAS